MMSTVIEQEVERTIPEEDVDNHLHIVSKKMTWLHPCGLQELSLSGRDNSFPKEQNSTKVVILEDWTILCLDASAFSPTL